MMSIINKESKSIVGAAAVVGILSLASRLVGLIRDRILAGEFGAGETLDVYYAAFKIPDFFFQLVVVGAISASFIPLFTRALKTGSKEKAWRFTNNIINLLGAIVIVLTLFLILFAAPLSRLVAPGFDAVLQARVAEFMRVMFISQILLTFSMILGSALQSLKRFTLYALAPIFYNLGIIAGAVWLVELFGIKGLAWGVVLGAGLHLLVQLYGALSSGFKYSFSARWNDEDVREMLAMTGPRVLGIGVTQILFVILAVIATTLSTGSVTMFQFAYNIQFFPVGVIGISYAIAAFPSFSEHLGSDEIDDFRKAFSLTIRQMLFFMIPMMAIFLVLRAQIVRVVVGAGAFDWTATITTSDTLAFFALTFIPQALVFILARAFFALHDTATPLTAGIVSALIGVISAFLFGSAFGVVGLAMAYSLSSTVNAGLLWMSLRTRVASLDEARIIQASFKLVTAGLVSGVIIQLVKPFTVSLFTLDTFFGVFSQGLIAGGLGVAVYLLIAKLLKSEELELFTSSMHRRLLKKIIPEESAVSENV